MLAKLLAVYERIDLRYDGKNGYVVHAHDGGSCSQRWGFVGEPMPEVETPPMPSIEKALAFVFAEAQKFRAGLERG